MRIDASQWFLSRRKYFAAGLTVGIFLLVFIANVIADGHRSHGHGVKNVRRQSADDDEIHDSEIYNAVFNSLKDWSQSSKEKSHLRNSHRVKRDEEIVCYGELGCFRDEGPFDYLDMLPSPPEEISTKFLFFSRKNLQNAQTFSYFNFTTMYGATHFNASNPTKVIIHGFGSTCTRMWAYEMQLAILREVEANVICVDWENGAALPNYVRAAVNTRLVGKQVALLIFWLNENLGTRTEDFHLIGFSLGAHVAGFTGQELQNLSRITGLDPAGPLFESYDQKVRLDASDALFVDVIHSNGDSLLMGGLGSWEPMGHVDFYPNGGRVQKGCSNLFLGAVRDFLWSASDGDGRSLCNHRRAYKFFTESLSNRCRFPAFSCESYDKFLTGSCFTWDNTRCGDMGYYADRLPNPKKGLLYLITRDDEPFCANQYRITVESSPSSASISTYGGLEAILIGHDYINETFLITQTAKDNMVAGNVIQRMIVAHPAITEPIQIQLKYTAYQSWLYSGISRWSMDSLILTNAHGKSMSFCTRLMLPSGIPVTIRLTAGLCLNRFPPPPPGVASNAVGRPIFPPLHPYDTYPTPAGVAEVSTTGISGDNNATSPTAPSTFENVELSMKPPAMTMVQNPSSAEIGPPYNMVTDMDWSNWKPVQSSQFMPLGPHFHKIQIGTPVETYPHVEEEKEVIPTFASVEDVKVQSEIEVNNSTNQSALIADETSTPVVLRICQIVANNSNDNSTELATNPTTISCVNPYDELKLNGTISNNETTAVVNGGLDFGSNPSTTSMEQEALQSNILVVHSSPTPTDISIPSESFWTAMHNNTLYPMGGIPQHQGADPDVVLPPHLSYILQQLESQGLGPKGSTINPMTSSGMSSNTINHNNLRHFGGASGLSSRVQMSATTSAGPNQYRSLVASSRALKHRPVSFSIRRQSKLLDGGGIWEVGKSEPTDFSQLVKISPQHMHGVNTHIAHYPRSLGGPLALKNPQGVPPQNTYPKVQISPNPVHGIAPDLVPKSYTHNLPPPSQPFGIGPRPVPPPPPSTNAKKNQQPASNPNFFVTNQPKGYYLMPHFSYVNANTHPHMPPPPDRANLGRTFKFRRIANNGATGGGTALTAAVNPTNIVPTNPGPGPIVESTNTNTNSLQSPNNANFFEEHRLRHLPLPSAKQLPISAMMANRAS